MTCLSKKKSYLWTFLLFLVQTIMNISTFLNIPVLRQIAGFFCLTFIPGYIIIRLLKLENFDAIETALFSSGISIAFLMFGGLFVNELSSIFKISKPLSLIPLMLFFNIFTFVGIVSLIYINNKNFMVKIGRSSLLALFLSILPVLSVVGAIWANVSGDNVVLLYVVSLIALIFVLMVLSKELLTSELYLFVVFIIAISLLFHASFSSAYIYTGDIHMEYFVFRIVKDSARWNSIFIYPWDVTYGRLNSMLSITILPTIYSVMLDVDAAWVFKILYPIIFSFVPLALYKLWQKNIGGKKAFIAAFFFMTTNVFYTEMLGLNRQILGELFFVLLLLVVSSEGIGYFKKMLCFTIFSAALITSHYSLAEIFFIFILFSWIILSVLKSSSRNIPLSMVVLFFVLMFTWYIYTSSSAVFESFLNYGDYVLSQLDNFFNPTSRGKTVLMGLGLEAPPSIWNAIGRTFAYITEALILVGFLGVLLKRVKIQFGKEQSILNILAMALLVALILVPGLASTLNMTRFYHILLFFLAPFCVIGAEVIPKLVFKRNIELVAMILLVVVLAPYFLFQSGFVYEVAGVQCWSVPLSKYRMDPSILMCNWAYVNGWKAYGAFWLHDHVNVQTVNVYKDWSAHELASYGMLRYAPVLSNTTKVSSGDFVYLSYLNVVEGVAITLGGRVFNTTDLSFISDINLVYSNGGCQIYKVPNR